MQSSNEPFVCPSLAQGRRGASLETLDANWPDIGRNLGRISPADHGIFSGRFDPQVSRLVLITFVDCGRPWEEEIYALKQLSELGEARLALSALDLMVNGSMAHNDSQVNVRLIDIWKTFGWVIREREERPGKMDAAWNGAYGDQ